MPATANRVNRFRAFPPPLRQHHRRRQCPGRPGGLAAARQRARPGAGRRARHRQPSGAGALPGGQPGRRRPVRAAAHQRQRPGRLFAVRRPVVVCLGVRRQARARHRLTGRHPRHHHRHQRQRPGQRIFLGRFQLGLSCISLVGRQWHAGSGHPRWGRIGGAGAQRQGRSGRLFRRHAARHSRVSLEPQSRHGRSRHPGKRPVVGRRRQRQRLDQRFFQYCRRQRPYLRLDPRRRHRRHRHAGRHGLLSAGGGCTRRGGGLLGHRQPTGLLSRFFCGPGQAACATSAP